MRDAFLVNRLVPLHDLDGIGQRTAEAVRLVLAMVVVDGCVADVGQPAGDHADHRPLGAGRGAHDLVAVQAY